MQNHRSVGPQYHRDHRVIAEFESSSLAFPLPLDATLEDLAALLARLGQPRGGMPRSIAVTIGA